MDATSASLFSIIMTTIIILSVMLLIDIYGSPVKMTNGKLEYRAEYTLAMNMIIQANELSQDGWEWIGAVNARAGEQVINMFRKPTKVRIVHA